ncbi:MAG: hypothetical protein IJF73_04645 [Clostridia bacterium]|nr:hypothetical protein [Clostridia bacterium]
MVTRRRHLARDTALFAMLGAMMLASKLVMEVLPNVHLLALFVGALTAVYRWRALIPLYVYVLLDGLIHAFSPWWIPYLYIFLPLFFGFLAIPRRAPHWLKAILYPTVAGLHGLLFGLLYAPFEALLYGLDSWEKVAAWLSAGLVFDVTHAVSNAVFGTLILPFSRLLWRLERKG